MAMVKPIVSAINAFDASVGDYIYFTSIGGNQVVKNTIIIRDNETNLIKYQNTKETFSSGQDVPPNILENGKSYKVSFITYGIDGEQSLESDTVVFYCLQHQKFI